MYSYLNFRTIPDSFTATPRLVVITILGNFLSLVVDVVITIISRLKRVVAESVAVVTVLVKTAFLDVRELSDVRLECTCYQQTHSCHLWEKLNKVLLLTRLWLIRCRLF